MSRREKHNQNGNEDKDGWHRANPSLAHFQMSRGCQADDRVRHSVHDDMPGPLVACSHIKRLVHSDEQNANGDSKNRILHDIVRSLVHVSSPSEKGSFNAFYIHLLNSQVCLSFLLYKKCPTYEGRAG